MTTKDPMIKSQYLFPFSRVVLVFEGKSGIKELIVDLFTVEVTTGKNAGPGFERLKASPYQQLKINYGNSL